MLGDPFPMLGDPFPMLGDPFVEPDRRSTITLPRLTA